MVTILRGDDRNRPFIEGAFLPEGKDEFYLRDSQVKAPSGGWRHLHADEIERLVKNNNTAESWDKVLVTDVFEPKLVKNNRFYGLVRIGNLSDGLAVYHDLTLRTGITDSTISNCDFGDDVAVHSVHFLSHYIIGDRCILFNVQEMCTTNHSKFGNGILKDGEDEDVRICIDVMNETGTRKIYPFDGMIAADAYLQAGFIEDPQLQERLSAFTQERYDRRRGYYGTVGHDTVIKNSSIIKDAKIGDDCYIKGASKLKNVTINSSEEQSSQIGEGVVLVNGIVGYGCHIFYNVIGVRFVMGNNSNLKYGARLIHSFLGDNSTISCCEVLNNLIFPAHEQHHNNSFLVAAVLMGQTNIAAGATIGSNHNSRANDNEIRAGRGFWPGLCSSLKHSCRFASYTLLSKADYPAEMHIPLPFSLVNNNLSHNELEVMPAFWWMYNMYALARNSWKYRKRDNGKNRLQHIEFDTYAPDSMEEVILGRKLLEVWTAKAWHRREGVDFSAMDNKELRAKGRELLEGERSRVDSLDVFGENMEKGRRNVRILKVYDAYRSYGEMLLYYGMRNVMNYLKAHPGTDFVAISGMFKDRRMREWENLGGQLMQASDVEKLIADIKSGALASWDDVHHRYDEIWLNYELDKLHHAYLSLCYLLRCDVGEGIAEEQWKALLGRVREIQQYVCDQVYVTRKKDYDNYFRKLTYRSDKEMTAALGSIEDNSFIKHVRKETEEFGKLVDDCLNLLQLHKS